MSMFNSVPSVLKRYKQLVGLGIASAMLIAIFVPSQNIPSTSGTRLCGVYYGHDYGPCPVNKPDVDKEKHREGTHHATIINNHVTIINQAISIAIASASASAASAAGSATATATGRQQRQQQQAGSNRQAASASTASGATGATVTSAASSAAAVAGCFFCGFAWWFCGSSSFSCLRRCGFSIRHDRSLSLQRMTVNLLRAWLQRLHLPAARC